MEIEYYECFITKTDSWSDLILISMGVALPVDQRTCYIVYIE